MARLSEFRARDARAWASDDKTGGVDDAAEPDASGTSGSHKPRAPSRDGARKPLADRKDPPVPSSLEDPPSNNGLVEG